ncbi:MAG: pyrroloquinoline quinone biosynthesis protein PqqB [Gammaproteobacteria bacterium]|nr:pyrroloquinoline quinone biosynthesis protein PqqB [Gammaproteobacteria bacterium]
MRVKVLGSAAGGGFPQWNCNCRLCNGVRTGSLQATKRTQSSIAVSGNRGDTTDPAPLDQWVLFNASPDILTQLQSYDPLQPGRHVRDTGIISVVLMDAQIDHTAGLLMLREHSAQLPLWTTAAVREDLSHGNPLLGVLEHYCRVDWHELSLDAGPSQIPGADNIDFQPLPLISNAPPFSPHRDKPRSGDTIGMLMTRRDNNKKLFYAPGVGQMEDHVWAAMQNADVVMVDGTMWTDDEMQQAGISTKTALSMGHLPQSGPGGMLEWLDQLPDTTRKILIHINNTNPILDENSSQRKTLQEHGIEIAFDGMEIDL